MKNKTIKQVAQLMNEFIDREIKISRLIYEDSKDYGDVDSVAKSLGLPLPSETGGGTLKSQPRQEVVPEMFPIHRRDSGVSINILDHETLRTSLVEYYFAKAEDEVTGELVQKPLPLLIYKSFLLSQ